MWQVVPLRGGSVHFCALALGQAWPSVGEIVSWEATALRYPVGSKGANSVELECVQSIKRRLEVVEDHRIR
jgi:hypothetical protein